MRADRVVAALMGVIVLAAAPATAQPRADKAKLVMADKDCADNTPALTVEAGVKSFLVDAGALKLQKQPKELLIMRREEMKFFRVPWVRGRTTYEVSSATAKPVFPDSALYPLKQGEKLTVGVMSASDEVILSCVVEVR